MKKVYYGLRASSELSNFFEENNQFSKECPYILRVKHFAADDIVPFHCAPTIEILLCDNVTGNITIDNKSYFFSKSVQVFVVPPNVIHTTSIYAGSGTQYVLQISPHHMKEYLNIEEMLNYEGNDLEHLKFHCPENQRIVQLFERLVSHDQEFGLCVASIAELFSILGKYKQIQRENTEAEVRGSGKMNNDILRKVLNYSLENYDQKISIDDVAELSGYSKSYFCNWFKSMTGITYVAHLNNVRNMYACLMLKSGMSVTECCHRCGFSSISYFVQQFKKKYKVTPQRYMAMAGNDLEDMSEDNEE